jgi:hypothetical protein
MLDENFPLINNATEGSFYPSGEAMLDENFPLINNATEGSFYPSGAAMLEENSPHFQKLLIPPTFPKNLKLFYFQNLFLNTELFSIFVLE